MLTLLSLLQARRDWPGPVLADRLGVTPRTVRRDVDRLRELGYTIDATKGPDGGYRLTPGADLPPLMFDDDQAVAIAVALQSAPASGIDIDEGAARALTTVRQVMPSRLRHRIDAIEFTGPAATDRVAPAVLEAVSAAVSEQRTLTFGYAEEAGPPRRVDPHAVVARSGRWYLVAWDLGRQDWRIFRLDRIALKFAPGARFERRSLPAPDALTFVAARFKGSHEDRWPCVGEVVMRLPAHEAATWVGDGQVEALSDDSCRLVVGSWSWIGLLATLTRYDAPFSIVGPEPLQDAADQLSRRLLAAAGPSEGQ